VPHGAPVNLIAATAGAGRHGGSPLRTGKGDCCQTFVPLDRRPD
jgi:hypothetical protein